MQVELKDLLDNTPYWWGDDNKEIYDNLIFIVSPLSCEDVCDAKAEYEKVHSYKGLFSGYLFVRIIERLIGGLGHKFEC